MARIAGVDLPREKRVEIGLTYVFGIGRKTSNEILAKTGINPDTRVKDLTEEEAAKLREVIERDYNVEGDLRREIGLNIKRLVEIGCYRGLRHRRGLPVRGQRRDAEPQLACDLQRLAADGAGRAQKRNYFCHVFLLYSCTVQTIIQIIGAANSTLSNRSSTPP